MALSHEHHGLLRRACACTAPGIYHTLCLITRPGHILALCRWRHLPITGLDLACALEASPGRAQHACRCTHGLRTKVRDLAPSGLNVHELNSLFTFSNVVERGLQDVACLLLREL